MGTSHRIQELRIADVMIPLDRYPSVGPECTMAEAMDVMVHSKIERDGRTSLPRVLLVLDEARQLLGTVRRRDIMRGLEPNFLVSQPLGYRKKLFDVTVDPNLAELSHDRIVRGIVENGKLPVRKVMRPIQVAVEERDHVIKGIYEMVSYGMTLLPVLRGERVVGVVRTVELFREMHRLIEAARAGSAPDEES